jgi:prohibitin 2
MTIVKLFFIAIFVICALIVAIGAPVFTQAGTANVIVQFGRVSRVATEGLSLKFPIIEGVDSMSVRTQLYTDENSSAASKDLQEVKINLSLNYRVDIASIGDIYRTLGKQYIDVIAHPAIQETVKEITAHYDAGDMILKRAQVKDDITMSLTKRLAARGIIVEVVNITNFDFSDEFMKAIESKQIAVQKVQEAENNLRRVEVEARIAEQQAKGEASAAIARAKGQQEAISILSQTLTPQYLQYLYIDKLAKDAKVIVVPFGNSLALNMGN